MRRSVAISEISRSTSVVRRSGAIEATADGSSRARQTARSSAIDAEESPDAEEFGSATCTGAGFAGVGLGRDGNSATAAWPEARRPKLGVKVGFMNYGLAGST